MLRLITVLALTTACSGGSYRAAQTPALAGGPNAPGAAAGGAGATNEAAMAQPPTAKEQLVIEGWLSLQVDNVQDAARSLRVKVEAAGGRIIKEQLSGSSESWSGSLKMRLPPAEVSGFIDWIENVGTIESKRIEGTDVSRQLFDQTIALENMSRTLERLRKLLEREGLEMKDILSIENEMTRLRGQIERIKGEQRFLRDRVSLATVEVTLERRAGIILGPEAKFYPGGRLAAMTLLAPGSRTRTRIGAGIVMHTLTPGGGNNDGGRFTMELDLFEDADGTGQSVLATMGGAVYSDFMGRGQRRFFNPYIGMRLGYGYLDGSAFAFAATAGVELFKHKYVMLDLNVRALGLAGKNFQAGVVSGGNLVFAF